MNLVCPLSVNRSLPVSESQPDCPSELPEASVRRPDCTPLMPPEHCGYFEKDRAIPFAGHHEPRLASVAHPEREDPGSGLQPDRRSRLWDLQRDGTVPEILRPQCSGGISGVQSDGRTLASEVPTRQSGCGFGDGQGTVDAHGGGTHQIHRVVVVGGIQSRRENSGLGEL